MIHTAARFTAPRVRFESNLMHLLDRIVLTKCLSMTTAFEQSSDARAKKLHQPSAEL